MKAFIISAILFILLIAMIFGNALYVKKVSEYIVSETEKLMNQNYRTDIMRDLEDYWEKHRNIVGFSVGHEELDHISEAIISLKASCESKNLSDANLYVLILKDAVEEIGRHEEVSFENLF